jgi:ribonuclease BN (tRNA processing enzyme)
VRVMLVPSSVSPEPGEPLQYLTSYLIGDTVAIDAGCLGFYRTPAEQMRIKHLFLTHSHLDHIASLPTFLANTYTGDGDCVTVYGNDAVLDCLQRDLFNDRVWPDFLRLSTQMPPFLRVRRLQSGETVAIAGLEVTAVEVNHAVPTLGYILRGPAAAVVIPSDTGPTEEIWRRAGQMPDLKAVFLEATVCNGQARLAETARHLTPRLFAEETAKLPVPVRWLVVHIHPRQREQTIRELEALGIPGLEIARPGVLYEF